MNEHARVPLCGLVADYNATQPPRPLPESLLASSLLASALNKNMTIRGFIVREFWDQFDRFFGEVSVWIRGGKIRYREDIVDGFQNTPAAFCWNAARRDFGKLIIHIGD